MAFWVFLLGGKSMMSSVNYIDLLGTLYGLGGNFPISVLFQSDFLSYIITYLFGPAIELNGNEMETVANKDVVLLTNLLLTDGQFTNKGRSLVRLFLNKTIILLTLYILSGEILASVLCSCVKSPTNVCPQLMTLISNNITCKYL